MCRVGMLSVVRVSMAVLLAVLLVVVEGSNRPPPHSHSRSSPSSRDTNRKLDDLMGRLDSSVQEKKRRLRGLPAIHYRTDAARAADIGGPTIVREGGAVAGGVGGNLIEGDDITNMEDTMDYVNVAPWTRRTTTTTPPPLAAFDVQMIKLAADNARWVKTEGKCELPQRRCEVVRSQTHPPGTVFWPQCALLHRCDQGTGCCPASKTCAHADTENVQMYFYVFGTERAKIEVMTFVNHTRCSCQLQSEIWTQQAVDGPNPASCRCPHQFEATTVNGRCTCDCDSSRSRCRRFKRGRRTFSATDISCITSLECTEPRCDYGPFLLRQRRCTKRRERDMYTTVRR